MAGSEGFEELPAEDRDAVLGDAVDIIVNRGITIGQFYGALGVNEQEFCDSDGVASAVAFMRGMLHAQESK